MKTSKIIDIIQSEPEFPGVPSDALLYRLEEILELQSINALLHLLQVTVRLTKQSIIQRIREEENEQN